MTPAFPLTSDFVVPAPVWLLKALGLSTLSVHLLFMNVVLGGCLLGAVYCLKGKERHLEAALAIARALPFAMAYTVTFAVAPLLFLQTLYGPLFYTAAILMAPFVWAIVPVLIVAYYTQYLLAWRWDRLPRGLRPVLFLGVALLLGYVGFVNVNLFTLVQDPESFRALYLADPTGHHLNAAEVTRWPRALHFLFGAVAVAGLFVALQGIRKLPRDPEQGRWQYRSGATWFCGSTLIAMVVGFWWLLALPREQMMTFMGGSALGTAAFGLGSLSGLAALAHAWLGINSRKPARMLGSAVVALVVAVACMVVMRDTLRDAALKPLYDVGALVAKPQWVAIGLFLLLFAGGTALCVWLLRLAAKAFPPPESPPLGSGGYKMPVPRAKGGGKV